MCNKKTYSSKEIAIENIEYQIATKRAIYLRTYYCITCNGWHLTKNRESKKRTFKNM